jgi:SAM-dependent methyltransferase
MTPQQFIAKWKATSLSERSACQQHFLDLCDLLQQPKPAEVDPAGEWYTFERGVEKTGGGKGWADVWQQGRFGWEYKGKHKDLKAAYSELLLYREALDNPPLLVVCDLDRFEIHTNFTGTAKTVYAFDLDGLADPKNILTLRRVFTDPDALEPGVTAAEITKEIAERFAKLADGMRQRGVPAHQAAHFLMKLMFCMFAEDIDLLPRDLFAKTVTNAKGDPARLSKLLRGLFLAMEKGEVFGADEIPWFNGGLFADAETIDLTPAEIKQLLEAAHADWSNVEPSIFGTLFERTLDPATRAPLGAHYTSREDIETLLRPVMLAPLRAEWELVKAAADSLWEQVQAEAAGAKKGRKTARGKFDKVITDFAERLAHVRVLDAACGSGNFLYVALHLLLDLEKEVLTYTADHGAARQPLVRPTQFYGLELNPYAAELAQVVIWIGFLQWMHFNGFVTPSDPVLQNVQSIRQQDAIIDLTDPANPTEPEWPAADFIVGNPPFLGGKMLRSNLGDSYVDALFKLWGNRVRPEADLCCYWFEKARAAIYAGRTKRAGLLATQGIRGGANRVTLQCIKESGDIFFAVSDRDWVLDGAAVHISMVGFDDGSEPNRTLDGKPVATINANLSAAADITKAARLMENLHLCFMGDTKGGPFDISLATALDLLGSPNINGRPSSDVVIPWCNGLDVTRRDREVWIVDFGMGTLLDEAAKYDKELDALRSNWLNPPEWTMTETLTFPGSAGGPWKRYVRDPDARGIGTVHYPRTVARDDTAAAKLKKRTLTNFYNEMPTWLKNAHAKLNEAVFAAYGWPATLTDDELLAKLLELNLERAKGQAAVTAAPAEREADEADEPSD